MHVKQKKKNSLLSSYQIFSMNCIFFFMLSCLKAKNSEINILENLSGCFFVVVFHLLNIYSMNLQIRGNFRLHFGLRPDF